MKTNGRSLEKFIKKCFVGNPGAIHLKLNLIYLKMVNLKVLKLKTLAPGKGTFHLVFIFIANSTLRLLLFIDEIYQHFTFFERLVL
jgi:hypothetical protein